MPKSKEAKIQIDFGDGETSTYFLTESISNALRDGSVVAIHVTHPVHGKQGQLFVARIEPL